MTFLRSAALALAGLTVAWAAAAQPRFDFDATPGRLPKEVVPSRYALTLVLDPQAPTFGGEVAITLQVRRPVAAIVLHARDLKAVSAVLVEPDGERRLDVLADEKAELWRLQPADGRAVDAGEHVVRIAYDGSVRADGSGLFQVPHTVDGRPARMLATQLEATYARRLFPCFDEPAFRAVFEVAVRAPKGWEVLANMPQRDEADEGGGATVLHRFAPTPPMPSYLVAVSVGRFDTLSGSADGVPLRILAAPGRRAHAAYALAAMQQILPYYNAYFGVPYALPKLDLLAVPGTRLGAMEDWGLISYAESLLLFDPAKSGTRAQRTVFGVVAHEVAHQWVGNLVTAASWEEIWLNEAFATWMAEKATDRFNPDWETALRRRGPIDWSMGRDAGPATRAIRSGAVLEDRVFDVFDSITYTKGGAVLSMIEQWIGPEAFRRGMVAYLQDRRYSNATAGDLWFHMGRASGRDIAAVAASWTDQAGFPLVSVSSRCEGGRTVARLAQRRFSTAGPAGPTRWKIPIVLLHSGIKRTLLLEGGSQSVTLPGCPARPLLLNPGGEGYYRVAYDRPQRRTLVQGFAGLPATARIALLSDTFALAQAGALPMADYLAVLAALPSVQGPGRPALFAQARDGLTFLDEVLLGHAGQPALHAMARALLAPELARLGWTARAGESSENEELRSALIRDLARYDDAAAVARADALFDAAEDGRAELPPTIREAVIRAVGVHADRARFDRLMARLQSAATEEDRWAYAEAVAASRDPALAGEVLELSLQPGLPASFAAMLPGLVGENGWHAAAAYRYTVEHWPALSERAGTMFGVSAWLLPTAASGLNDRDRANELRLDQQRLAGEPGRAAAATAAARIELLARVRDREGRELAGRLAELTRRLFAAGR
jgi:aminopeptidase N